MSKSKTFNFTEQLLRLAVPVIVLISIVAFLLWIVWKITQGIVYVWDLIDWSSIGEWLNLHFWWTLGIILLAVGILYLVRLTPRVRKTKSSPSTTLKASPAKSGPRWTTVAWVAAVVFAIFHFQVYFQGCGRARDFEKAIADNQMLPQMPHIVSKEIRWPSDKKLIPLKLGDYQFVPGVWYIYTRDETSLVYIKALSASTATLRTQKLGSEKRIYLKQRFNEYGSCKTIEDRTDGSPGKWYITTDQPVTVRVTGTISK